MTALPMTRVVAAAYRAGFRGSDCVTAVAIAAAESGLNPLAHNDNPRTGDDSYGLWQINFLGRLLAPRLVQFHIGSPSETYDPDVNARCAFILYTAAGHGFHDWSTYNHGSHKPHLDDAQRAYTQWLTDNVTPPAPSGGPKVYHRYMFLRQPFMDGTAHGDHDVQDWQHVVGVTPDGLFGPITAGATRKWQARHKDTHGHPLSVDGVVGPLTAGSAGRGFSLK